MTDAGLRSPQDDLEQRRPVWDALATLLLDTQLDDADFAYLASLLAPAPYTNTELAAIYRAEAEPVCKANIGMVPGYWSAFPAGWVEQRILDHGLDATHMLAGLQETDKPIAWGWDGLQQRVSELRRLNSAHRDSDES